MPFGGKSFEEQVQLLDTLQKEVNVVLEQTGRLLATSNANNKAATSAQAVKLKSILPGAEERFNDALDNLGEELDHAKLILRRDLAIAREREGLVKPATTTTQKTQNGAGSKRPSPSVEDEAEQQAKRVKLTPETKAPHTQGSELEANGQNGASAEDSGRPDGNATNEEAAPTKEPPSTPPSAPDDSKDEPNAPSKPVASSLEGKKDQPAEDQPADAQPTTAPASESKPADNPLALDTQTAPPNQANTDSAKPPDTAITNNADLDSLFGGPTASLPTGDAQDQPKPQTTADPDIPLPTTTDPTDPNDFSLGDGDFDFGLPPTGTDDNDNISALLPGLQDYASAQPGGGDFDDGIFNTDIGAVGGDGGGGQEYGDFLDDFDFEAELGNMGGGNGNGSGSAGGGEGQGDLFNFE